MMTSQSDAAGLMDHSVSDTGGAAGSAGARDASVDAPVDARGAGDAHPHDSGRSEAGHGEPRPPTGTITEFDVPTPGAYPNVIVPGPDGYLWFMESYAQKMGRIDTSGEITEFPLPPFGYAAGVAVDPDGNIWFGDGSSSKIGRLTPSGVVSEFRLPVDGGTTYITNLTAGPDGNIWFTTADSTDCVGRVTTSGEVTMVHLDVPPTDCFAIAPGIDGGLLLSENLSNRIDRLSLSGHLQQYTIGQPYGAPDVTVGPDGNIWLSEFTQGKIGRLTPNGLLAEFSLPNRNAWPVAIVTGPDGNLWFTENAGNAIGRITPAGVITEYPLPYASSTPVWIAAGADGNLWFTENGGNKIGRITP